MEFAASVLNVNHIVQAGGILVVAFIIFAETGMLVGFFLPGDTLLIAAGIYAAAHPDQLSVWALLPAVAIAAILGYEVGYRIGAAAGPRFFKRTDGILFRADYVTRTQVFFTKHGGKSILLARFIAVIRTIVPLVAGMGRMNRTYFRIYNIIGGVLWTFSVTLSAYWVGSRVHNLDKYLVDLLLLGMLATIATIFIESLRSKKRRTALKQAFREEIKYFFKR